MLMHMHSIARSGSIQKMRCHCHTDDDVTPTFLQFRGKKPVRVWPFDGRTNKKNAYVQSFMFSTLPPIRTQLAKNIQLRVWTRWFNTPTNLVARGIRTKRLCESIS